MVREVPPEKDLRLRQMCTAWESGDLSEHGTQIITLADEALEILMGVGWVTERSLPNNAVDALEYSSFLLRCCLRAQTISTYSTYKPLKPGRKQIIGHCSLR